MEIYVSVDIETDGPIPGSNSMLSVGAAACTLECGVFDTFAINLLTLPDASPDEKTQREFWDKHPLAYAETREKMFAPHHAMELFEQWLKELLGKPVMVAYPAGFDFRFIYWYFIIFLGVCPFGFQCIDMKTYAMAKLKIPFKKTVKAHMPEVWFDFPGNRHTHIAVDDAIEQAHLWLAMLRHCSLVTEELEINDFQKKID